MENTLNAKRFSFTKINTFITCPRKFYLNYCLKLVPRTKSKALAAGFVMSQALDVYRRTNDVKLGIDEMIKTWKTPEADCLDFDADADPQRSLERLIEIFKAYARFYPDESKFIIMPEVTFQHPLADFNDEIVFDGRTDGCLLVDGTPALIEDKTTSRMGDFFFREKSNSFQIFWYLWVAKEMGFFKVGDKSTTPKAYINGIYIHSKTDRFERKMTIKTNRSLDYAKDQMVMWIKAIIRANEAGSWPCDYGHCEDYGGCQYKCLQGVDLESKMFSRIAQANFDLRED